MSKKSMLEKLGLNEDVLKPKDKNEEQQRLDDIENAILELAELLSEVEQNG